MKPEFGDILSRITEPPSWWDENGTPRYGPFTPDACSDIYADRVGLFEIACQACEQRFMVEMNVSRFDRRYRRQPNEWHYGDPPRHDCVGDTMNCDDVSVVEFWIRNQKGDFERHPEVEGPIDGTNADN